MCWICLFDSKQFNSFLVYSSWYFIFTYFIVCTSLTLRYSSEPLKVFVGPLVILVADPRSATLKTSNSIVRIVLFYLQLAFRTSLTFVDDSVTSSSSQSKICFAYIQVFVPHNWLWKLLHHFYNYALMGGFCVIVRSIISSTVCGLVQPVAPRRQFG